MIASLCRDYTLASPTQEKRHWEFPNLEIPEAPLQHGGAPLVPPSYGGDLLGHTLREGQQQVLVCARSRPTSASVL